MREAFAAWNEVLNALNWGRIELEEIADRVTGLMCDWGVSSSDAVHLATIDYTGSEAIATTDKDFAAVPATRLRILTPGALVGACRRRRSR